MNTHQTQSSVGSTDGSGLPSDALKPDSVFFWRPLGDAGPHLRRGVVQSREGCAIALKDNDRWTRYPTWIDANRIEIVRISDGPNAGGVPRPESAPTPKHSTTESL